VNRRPEPAWVPHAVWWQVYPLGFLGAEQTADGSLTHRLGALTDWFDYAVDLGASGVALGPIFRSETHGYDTVDHFRIDPRLGDEADFAALVDAAHGRGLRVLLDGVFNHVGRGFPAFARVLAEGPSAPEASWFRPATTGGASGADQGFAVFEGHWGLVALNHDEPAVADYVAKVMSHWLAAGADGWRLDAAYAVPPRFWADVLPRVRADHPDMYVVGEVIHGDYEAIVAESTFDSVTQYELWKSIWNSIEEGNLFELAWTLDRHNSFLASFVPFTFVGNHDVTRIASRISDERHVAHALVVLLTVGGTPCVYSGDEQAFRGVKEERAGGDDAVRPAFPADASGLAPEGWPMYRLHQELIGLRRRHPWLHAATTAPLHLTNSQLVYRVSGDGDDHLVVALNLDDAMLSFDLDHPHSVLAGAAATDPGPDAGVVVRVPPHGWAVLG
jgi:cyclomaltodextrinase